MRGALAALAIWAVAAGAGGVLAYRVQQPHPAAAAPPTTLSQVVTPPPLPPGVPADPRHGPTPVCWSQPGQGLAPGATCPPRGPARP